VTKRSGHVRGRTRAARLPAPPPAPTLRRLLESAGRAIDAGEPVALVTVVDAVGSAPREIGAKMIVHRDGRIEGTIGGGTLEALAIREALRAIEERKPRRTRFNLGASGPRSIGMFCGGEVEVFADVLLAPRRLVLLGAGHVSERLARVADVLGLPYAVADDREELASADRFPFAGRRIVGPLPDAIDDLAIDSASYVIIVTRCHQIDMECLARLLGSPAPYIGMIGSVTKVRQVFRRLAKRGIDAAADPRVFAPVGLSLGSSEPGAIAISIAAEVLKVAHGASGVHLRQGAGTPAIATPIAGRAPAAARPAVAPGCALVALPAPRAGDGDEDGPR
jgi:xanthine dehydrogenase accessory factor